MSFLKNIEEIRVKVRQDLDRGPVTVNYPLRVKESVNVLNEALATEIMCVRATNFIMGGASPNAGASVSRP